MKTEIKTPATAKAARNISSVQYRNKDGSGAGGICLGESNLIVYSGVEVVLESSLDDIRKAVNSYPALVAVAELNRKLAMLALQSEFYATGHAGEVKQFVDDSFLAQDNLAAIRGGGK